MLAPDTLVQNRYRVVRLVGQGGMGAVYQATDQRLGSTVALKQRLIAGVESHAGPFRKAFEREARLLASLRHPALPKVIDHFSDETGQFLVMEFIPGADLSTLLATRGEPFELEQALRWADQLLDALDYMHSQQPPVVHRDIKPQNIKITPRGEAILLDFGLAKDAAPHAGTTSASSLVGYTPQYAPLEQIQGSGIGPRSDLYALAATLYYLLTYAAPVDALTRATALLNGQPDPLRPARELRPNVPAAVDAVLTQALALEVAERPASAAAMRRSLATALDMIHQATVPAPNLEKRTLVATPLGASAATQPIPPAAPAPQRGGSLWPLLIGALIFVLLAAGAAALFLGQPRAPAPAAGSPTANAPVAFAATLEPIATATLTGARPSAPVPATAAPPTATADTGGLRAGQAALTRTPATRVLWSAARGGQPVNERPRLFGGAQVTILAIEAAAVQVRTAEGIEGWIHEPAGRALTPKLSDIGILRRFNSGVQVQVIWERGIPMRDAPRSSANKLVEQIAAGQGGVVLGTLGDWLEIKLEDGSSGWVRWYYDGKIYVDLAGAQAPPALGRRLLVQNPRLEGDDVRALQERLSLLGYWPGDADGIYGPATAGAVRSFQTNNQLEVDGIVGEQTWQRLFSADAVPYEDE